MHKTLSHEELWIVLGWQINFDRDQKTAAIDWQIPIDSLATSGVMEYQVPV